MNDFEIKIIGQNFADKEPEIRVLINGIDDTAAAAVMRECARRQARYAKEREKKATPAAAIQADEPVLSGGLL